MRLSAAFDEDACRYRVYDYPQDRFRVDLCWVDDELNQLGVGYATWGQEHVFRIEKRRRVLIIPGVNWVAIDLPEKDEENGSWESSDTDGRKKIPELVLK